MKYRAQNLAKALLKLLEKNPQDSQKIITGFVYFCKKKHLTYLLPNLLKYLKIEAKRELAVKTLKIISAISLNEGVVKDIQKLSGAQSPAPIEIIEDKNVVAGFIAYYQNKIIDASLKNNLHLLKNKLYEY